MYGYRAILILFVITMTQNLSNEKYKLVYLDKHSPIKNLKDVFEKDIHTQRK